MPFEISPKFVEAPAKTREELGRAALRAIAEHVLSMDEDQIHMMSWGQCVLGVSRDLPEVVATGLRYSSGVPTFEDKRFERAADAAFGLPRTSLGLAGWSQLTLVRGSPHNAARAMLEYIDETTPR